MNKDALIADLKRDEGFVGHAYTDSVGVVTAGYGTNIDAKHGGYITREEAEMLLRNRLGTILADLEKQLPWIVTRPGMVQRAVGNLSYNIGVQGVLGFKKMLACLQAGDYNGAATAALDSKWATQVGARAERIAALLRGPHELQEKELPEVQPVVSTSD